MSLSVVRSKSPSVSFPFSSLPVNSSTSHFRSVALYPLSFAQILSGPLALLLADAGTFADARLFSQLFFGNLETICLFVSVILVNLLIQDGKSNYMEGTMLVALYLIIAICFWVS